MSVPGRAQEAPRMPWRESREVVTANTLLIIVSVALIATLTVLILVLLASGAAWDQGFAAGQEYEEWFCRNVIP